MLERAGEGLCDRVLGQVPPPARAPIIVTPFLLAGATSAVSVAGGIAQQVAEALSAEAIAQLVRPGVPCLYGSFFTSTDMRTGSPAFGTPESVYGVLAGAQMARHYDLPFQGGGGTRLREHRRCAGRGRDPDDAVGGREDSDSQRRSSRSTP